MASTSKGRKKKRNTLLLLFACIAVFAVGYALLSIYDTRDTTEIEEEGEEEKKLLSIKRGDISSIEFKNSFVSMKLLKEKKQWFWEEDKKFPLNQDYVADMENIITDLTVLRFITKEPEDMAEFGLENPKITVNIIMKGHDKETVLYLGDESPSEDKGYYCFLNDEKTVYEVDADVFTAFNYSKDQMMVLEDTPEIIAGQVTKLEVRNTKEFNFIAVNNAIGDSSSWSIEAPYSNPVVGDESEISTFLGNYESFSYIGAVEYHCKDFSKYGLDQKKPETAWIQLDYYELVDKDTKENTNKEEEEKEQERIDHKMKIIIGNKDKNGNYYVRVNDSDYVYLMDQDSVDNLLPDKAYPYVEKTVSRVSTDNMIKMTFLVGNKDYILTRKEKTIKNDDGEEETQTDYFLNKKIIEISEFNMLTTSWNTLETAKEMTTKEKKQVDMQTPVIIADIESPGIHQVVEAFAFDKNYYAIKDGKSMIFLVDKRDMDIFIEKLKEVES